MVFEWDDRKAALNVEKHGITFEEAAEILSGECVTFRANTEGEARFKAIGRYSGEYFAIVYTIRGGAIRIISARHAAVKERNQYEKHID